jgi:tRNA dimethylallyltransferase
MSVIAVFGPTASGKSAVARAVAERVGGEVVSADSMQVYRGLPVLTNQDAPPPLLAAIWPLSREASVADYQRLAHAAVDRLVAEGRVPVVAGGTGLYLRAALSELRIPPAPAEGARERWQERYDADPEGAHALLAELDPAAAAGVHPNDRRRVVRALELAEAGESLAGAALWGDDARHPTAIFGLDVPREELTRRIEERSRAMFEHGVEEEVARALAGPVSRTAEKAIGLRELAELPREQALERLVVRTRRYAAYQRKWMRRIPGLVSVRADRPPEETADAIVEVARARQRLPGLRAG